MLLPSDRSTVTPACLLTVEDSLEVPDTSAGGAISLAAKEYTGEKLAVVGDHTIPKRHQPNERGMGSDPSQARMPSDLFEREQDSTAS